MELILLIWLPLCIAVGILASRYNRSGFGWFVFSLLLSPLLGFAFVLACGPYVAPPIEEQPQPTAPATPAAPIAAADSDSVGDKNSETEAGPIAVVGLAIMILVVVAVAIGNNRAETTTAKPAEFVTVVAPIKANAMPEKRKVSKPKEGKR